MGLQENAAMNAALDKHEGCNIHGWLEVQRVAGNFHLSVHADHYFAMRSVCYFSHTLAQQPFACTPADILARSSESMSHTFVHHVIQAIAPNYSNAELDESGAMAIGILQNLHAFFLKLLYGHADTGRNTKSFERANGEP